MKTISLPTFLLIICSIFHVQAGFGQTQKDPAKNTVEEKQFKPGLVVQTGHSEQVESLAYSPDGKFVASGGAKEVKLWDASSGIELRTFRGNRGAVTSVAFSPDGNYLASIDTGDAEDKSYEGFVIIWDLASGKIKRKFDVEYSPMLYSGGEIAFSPDGKWIAAIDSSTLSVWDVENGKPIKKFEGYDNEASGIPDRFFSIAFSPDGKLLAVSSTEALEIWDTLTGKKITSIKGKRESELDFENAFSDAVFSQDGKYLSVIGFENSIELRDVKNWKVVKKFREKDKTVTSLQFSPDGKVLVHVSTDISGDASRLFPGVKVPADVSTDEIVEDTISQIEFRNIETGKVIRTLEMSGSETGLTFGSVAFSPDGRNLISTNLPFGMANGVVPSDIAIWNVETGKKIRVLESHSSEVISVVFSPDGKYLAGYGALDGSIKLLRLTDNFSARNLEGHSKPVDSLVFNSDGTRMADVAFFAGIRLWDPVAGKLIKALDDTEYFDSIGFSADGKLLYGEGTREGELSQRKIFVWDALTGKEIERTKSDHLLGMRTTSRDGKLVVSEYFGRENPEDEDADVVIQIKEFETGALRHEFFLKSAYEKHGVVGAWSLESVAISPDNKWVAGLLWDSESFGTPDRYFITLWNSETGAEVDTWEFEGVFAGKIAFSADSNYVVGHDVKKSIQLWEAKTGRKIEYDKLPDSAKVNIGGVAVTRIGGRMVIAKADGGKIGFIDGETKREMVSFISLDKDDWAFVSAEGLFDATENAQKLMHFVIADEQIGFEIIELDQLKSSFYVPDLFEKLLRGEKLSKVEDLTVTLFPDVGVSQSKTDPSTLNLKLKNRGGGIGRVEIRVDGRELTANALKDKKLDPDVSEYDLAFSIPPESLRTGKNTVEIITWNKADYFRSRKSEFPVFKDGDGNVRGVGVSRLRLSKKPAKPPDFYAIIAGVSDYVGSNIDLRYAAKDAGDMSLAIGLGARKLFCGEATAQSNSCEKVHIRLLSTEEGSPSSTSFGIKDFQKLAPIKENFRKVFAEVAQNAKPEDVVLIYLAGHGNAITSPEATEESAFPDLYLYATSEANSIDAADLRNKSVREATTVSSLELADWMKGIRADKKAFILDTCAAGAAQAAVEDLGETRAEGAEKIRALDRLRERTGFFVLMGSAADAVSYEASTYRQGLLTYSLLEAMTVENKLRNGRFVDVQGWFANSVDRVEVLAQGIGGIQKPRLFSSSFSKSFDVGEITREDQKKIPLAQPVPIILRPVLTEEGKRTDRARFRRELEKRLSDVSYAFARGKSVPFNYINANAAANGLVPNGSYRIEGEMVTVEIDLIRDEVDSVATIRFTAKRADVIDKMVEEISAKAKQISSSLRSN